MDFPSIQLIWWSGKIEIEKEQFTFEPKTQGKNYYPKSTASGIPQNYFPCLKCFV